MINELNPYSRAFTFAVISGKGGVGKSMTSINLADTLSRSGHKVALVDADLGLSNCATMLNETVQYSVGAWIQGECTMEEIPQQCGDITLVTGADLPEQQFIKNDIFMDAMDQVLHYISKSHDFIIIDAPAGAGETTLWALDSADLTGLILVDEPSAISDVYRLVKFVFDIDPGYKFATIVNFAESEKTAQSTSGRFNNILEHFLDKQVSDFGFLPASDNIKMAVKQQLTLSAFNENDPVLQQFEQIAQNLTTYTKTNENKQYQSAH